MMGFRLELLPNIEIILAGFIMVSAVSFWVLLGFLSLNKN